MKASRYIPIMAVLLSALIGFFVYVNRTLADIQGENQVEIQRINTLEQNEAPKGQLEQVNQNVIDMKADIRDIRNQLMQRSMIAN